MGLYNKLLLHKHVLKCYYLLMIININKLNDGINNAIDDSLGEQRFCPQAGDIFC